MDDIELIVDAFYEYIQRLNFWQHYVLDITKEKEVIQGAFSSRKVEVWNGPDVQGGKSVSELATILREYRGGELKFECTPDQHKSGTCIPVCSRRSRLAFRITCRPRFFVRRSGLASNWVAEQAFPRKTVRPLHRIIAILRYSFPRPRFN